MRSPRLTVRDLLVFLVSGIRTQAFTHMKTLLQTDMYTEKTCTASTLTHAFTCALISRVSYFLPLLCLSLSLSFSSHTNTHSMTQAGRMCLLPAQISSGSPRHEITWIRDDRLSDRRKTTPWALAVQHQTIVRQCAGDPSHMVRWNFYTRH